MPRDAKIRRKSLHDELASLVRNMIIEGELSPGKRIREQSLCTRFGVSRTPLREALKVLSVEGLVELLPNRGSIVVRITRKQADDVIGLLGVLEAYASALSCSRIEGTRLAKIRALHEQMMENLQRGERQPAIELNRAFRRALIEAADNETLAELHQMLSSRLGNILSVARGLALHWDQAIEDHEPMLAALEAKDSNALAALARQRVGQLAGIVKEAFDTLEAKGAKPTSASSAPLRS
jgi:DNA-binding GntR family transcriptional regulator